MNLHRIRALGWRRTLAGTAVTLALLGAATWLYDTNFSQQARELERATAAFKTGKFDVAVRLAEPHAARGNAEAETWMGLAYAFGQGVPRDRDRAQVYYLSAQGDRAYKSFFWVAEQYDRGVGQLPPDHSEALAWYAAAAEMGDQRAQRVLARAFKDGLYGVYPDPIAAAFWARKAGDE